MGCRSFTRKTGDHRMDLLRDVAVYWLVNAFLHVVNMLTSADSYWAIWPALGWGLALALRAVRLRGGVAA